MILAKAQLHITLNFEGSQKSPDWNNYIFFLTIQPLKIRISIRYFNHIKI